MLENNFSSRIEEFMLKENYKHYGMSDLPVKPNESLVRISSLIIPHFLRKCILNMYS